MSPAELLSIPIDQYNQLSDEEQMIARSYAAQLGKLFGRSSYLLGITLCDAPEYKHFILDTLNEHGLVDREHSLLTTDLLRLQEDPRVQHFIRWFNREVAESVNPF